MAKFCPNCGKELPDDSKFCMECGYDFSKSGTSKASFVPKRMQDSDSVFLNGKIFLVLIVIVLIVGAVFILSSGGNNNNATDTAPVKSQSEVALTITDVSGYDGSVGNKTVYTFYVEALFTKVPSNTEGYIVKTIYCDSNNTEIGSTIESLSQVYYESDYALSFGYYTSYKLVKVDNVKVQIIKDNEVVDEFTSKVDQNKIRF